MKSIVATVIICLFCCVFAWWTKQQQALTEEEFRKSEKYLNMRIDTLRNMCLFLQKNQDTIKKDLDTLKNGQRIIFDEVKKKNQNFWSLF
jgi:hypothetical protein